MLILRSIHIILKMKKLCDEEVAMVELESLMWWPKAWWHECIVSGRIIDVDPTLHMAWKGDLNHVHNLMPSFEHGYEETSEVLNLYPYGRDWLNNCV